MAAAKGRIIAGGRVALPADMRRTLGLAEGDTVYFDLDGESLRLRSAKSALKGIQDTLRRYAPEEGLVSDELIAERRAEAARE
jgi:bifunctional DNA-binding transcriptional regulator/antitoxin component of YhaV-PrlF toxin-antitoxin module